MMNQLDYYAFRHHLGLKLLGIDGSDDDVILFCFNIYLKVCVISFLLSFNKLS